MKANQTNTIKRETIWFKSPYNNTIKTKTGKMFFKIIEKHFSKHNKISKMINKNTVKISYSCKDNIEKLITKHNKNTQ